MQTSSFTLLPLWFAVFDGASPWVILGIRVEAPFFSRFVNVYGISSVILQLKLAEARRVYDSLLSKEEYDI
jgi:hypothetical protein